MQITCAIQGFRVADGNTWWYLIASPPWSNQYYVSADVFYNNGRTSGSLLGTPFVDPAVPLCPASGSSSAPPPQRPVQTVILHQGPPAPAGYRYAIALSGFWAETSVTVTCYDSVSPHGFYTFTLRTNGTGSAFTQSYCYSADGPDHWVVANGVQSNTVVWGGGSTGGGGSPIPTTTAPGSAPPSLAPTDQYVALGDSYSSGEGTGNYYLSSNTTYNQCHRSPHSYAELLDASQHLGGIDFVACSGAITADLFSLNHEGNHDGVVVAPGRLRSGVLVPPQSSALSPSTKYVTLTLGGNDVGFENVLKECIFGNVGPLTFYGRPGCSSHTAVTNAVYKRIEALEGKAKAFTPTGAPIHSYASILRRIHQLAPHAKVYIAGYPELFGTDFGSTCGVGTVVATNVPYHAGDKIVALKLARSDVLWLNWAADVLDLVIKAAAKANGATYVDPNPEFRGHRMCDASNSWIQYVSGRANGTTNKVTYRYKGSFHPNIAGQRLGYEIAFKKAGL